MLLCVDFINQHFLHEERRTESSLYSPQLVMNMLDPSQKGVTCEDMYMWLYEFGNRKVKYPTGLRHSHLAKIVRSKQPEYFPNPDSDAPALVLGDSNKAGRGRPRRQVTKSAASPSTTTPQLPVEAKALYPSLDHLPSVSEETPDESSCIQKKRASSGSDHKRPSKKQSGQGSKQKTSISPSVSIKQTKKKADLVIKDEDHKPNISSLSKATGPITPSRLKVRFDLNVCTPDNKQCTSSISSSKIETLALETMKPEHSAHSPSSKHPMATKNLTLLAETCSQISDEDIREEMKALQKSLIPSIDFPPPVSSQRLIAEDDLNPDTCTNGIDNTYRSHEVLKPNPYIADLMTFKDFDIFESEDEDLRLQPLETKPDPVSSVVSPEATIPPLATTIDFDAETSRIGKDDNDHENTEITNLRTKVDELNGQILHFDERIGQIEDDLKEILSSLVPLIALQEGEISENSDSESASVSEEESLDE